ncbi:hypothetical protein C1J03_16850 [Sulfitobacter sp. SK012]|uniref:hypothetical protein n=1 Tax=Sulfitobacter sp. SK012 TaxID=1389005 RepID=UPI000E0BDF4E|nr:hypothetical protein [Sulfitobacter sp. SK012]AXI47525.1 hypothetical protein C1J03_16850 [Sulfitobacter sp. SK012]
MAKEKRGLIEADENDKKSVQELLEIRKEHQQKKIGEVDHNIQEMLQEEFHQVWDDTIMPALERLKRTSETLLERFSDYEDEFKGYLRDREPDVDVELLAEIYGYPPRAKANEKQNEDSDREMKLDS